MKKLLSILLAIVMLLGIVPTGVFALEDTTVATLTTADGEVIEYDDLKLLFADLPLYLECEVVLLQDVRIPDGEYLYDFFNDYVNFTFDFNGHTITGNYWFLLGIGSSHNLCDVVFKDSVGTGGITNLYVKSESDYSAPKAIASSSNVTFESGNYKVADGTFFTTRASSNVNKYTPQTIINGGTFETAGNNVFEFYYGNIIINDGVFKGHVKYTCDNSFSHTDSTGEVYGGEFHNGLTANGYLNDLIADGYGAFDENGEEFVFTELTRTVNEYCIIKETTNPERDYVAKVILPGGSEKPFISFNEAVLYLMGRGYHNQYIHKEITLVLLKDIVIDKTFSYENYYWSEGAGEYIVDLNGHTIQNSPDNPMPVFMVERYSIITIKDSVGTGKIICYNSTHSDYQAINKYENTSAILNFGTLTLDNVTVEYNRANITSNRTGYPVCVCNMGKLEVVNATLTNNTNEGCVLYNNFYENHMGRTYGETVIYDGIFTGQNTLASVSNGGNFTLYGGTYNGTLSTTYASKWLGEGYAYFDASGEHLLVYSSSGEKITETNFTVKNLYPVSVTDANGSTKYYGSLDFVYNEATSGSLKDCLIKLLAVLVEGGDLPLNFKTTIDLNGKTLNAENGLTIAENGDLVITDSAGNGQINGGVTVDGGTLDVQAGTINGTANGITNENGNVTVSGGEINGAQGYSDILVSGDNVTVIKGGNYPDGFSIAGSTINNALDSEYVFYNDNGQVAVGDNQMTISGNVVVYEKTLIHAMSTQIRFDLNEDNSFAGTVDIRTRAKISDSDFKKYIADTNDEAEQKISAAGFVYSTIDKTFDMSVAQSVAKGEAVEGYTNAPVTYIQDCDGYYMFACVINNIPQADIVQGIHSYAYMCVNGIWYFFPAPSSAHFNELYDKYYPMAAEEYGWTTEAE